MTVRPEQSARFFLRGGEAVMIDRDGVIPHPLTRAPDLEVGTRRNDDVTILRLAKHRTFGLGDTYDFKLDTIDRDFLPDRVGVGQQMIFDVLSDERDRGFAATLDLIEEATFFRREIAD